MSFEIDETVVLIKGAGDLASGAAVRLHRCGFRVAMTELPRPLTVRRSVAFAQAVFDGEQTVEGITARRCSIDEVDDLFANALIPLLVDPATESAAPLAPQVLVDAIMAKRNSGTSLHDADLVVALGPGFSAGRDCHALIETQRGHDLGRVIWNGEAEADTGRPGPLSGGEAQGDVRLDRALRAPAQGRVLPCAAIGERLETGQVIANLIADTGEELSIRAPFPGVLRGLIHPGVAVRVGMKIGDLDPRADAACCFTVSDKSLAVAGGVLEAILTDSERRSIRPSA